MTDQLPPGFKVVPSDPYYAVSEDGRIWNIRAKILSSICRMPSGYRTVGLKFEGKNKTRSVHRLVALAWIPIPEHLKNIVGIEVNHKDCDLDNNAASNLEWVTAKKNIRHAYLAKRYGDKRLHKEVVDELPDIIQARNLLTGMIKVFPTCDACAKELGINRHRLTKHLNSEQAGLITVNWWVVRKETDEDWPEIPDTHMVENRWDHHKGFWVCIKDNCLTTASSLQQLAKVNGVSFNTLVVKVKNDGERHTFKDAVYWFDAYPNADLWKNAPLVGEKPKFISGKEVLVTWNDTVDKKTFPSIKAAAIATGFPSRTLEYTLQNKKGFHKNIHICYT